MNNLKAYQSIYRYNKNSKIKYWVIGFFIALAVILFLPWTQNVRARGNVTTLRQEQRPQELNSIIPGKIQKWFVKEGDHVNQGDTILHWHFEKPYFFAPIVLVKQGRYRTYFAAACIV